MANVRETIVQIDSTYYGYNNRSISNFGGMTSLLRMKDAGNSGWEPEFYTIATAWSSAARTNKINNITYNYLNLPGSSEFTRPGG